MAGGTAPITREELDAIQQRLFAVALGLRSLRDASGAETLVRELERLEASVDGLIREVRSRASAPLPERRPPRSCLVASVGSEERRGPHGGPGR
jgi:cob(I)alamin adenosyltransferase